MNNILEEKIIDPITPIYVAVYGSLKKGFGNHRLLASSKLVCKGYTPPIFKMISFMAYPGILLGGDKHIEVEVYEVDTETFKRLDGLEGYPNFYDRFEVDIYVEDEPTKTINAWIYFLEESDHFSSKEEYINYSKNFDKDIKVITWNR